MPSINIQETDNTVYGLSTVTNDNIVFIPGSAITGPSDEPVLIGSGAEFISKFGPYAPERGDSTVGSTWDYAYNLLLYGLPVLFKRITTKTDVGGTVTSLVTKATADLKDLYTEVGVVVGKVTELYGGSYGNSLNVTVERLTTSIYFRVYRDAKLIESVRVINITVGETEANIRAKLLLAIPMLSLTTVKIEITDPIKFALAPIVSLKLAGGTDADDEEVLAQIPASFEGLLDKYVYDIKFVTSGGYTDSTSTDTPISDAMILLAETRGDSTSILDMPLGTPPEDVTSFWTALNTSYGTAFGPWFFTKLKDRTEKWMPPSFIFLRALAKSLSAGNKIWNPPAGVKRASITEAIKPEYEIGGSILDSWQETNPQCVNPIMKLRQYGYVIFGQRTLYATIDGATDKRSGLQELGVRITANEIKRLIFNISLGLSFDQNTLRTWNEFRGLLDPQLAQMKADRGITDYQIIMDETVITDQDVNENKVRGNVRVSITRASEDFDINFDLDPQSTIFTETVSEFII